MSRRVQYHHLIEYEIHETAGIFEEDNPALAQAAHMSCGKPQLVVVDQTVYAAWGTQVDDYLAKYSDAATVLVVDATESYKSMDTAMLIAASADRAGIVRRSSPLVAIGGGVLCDLVGFAASIYRRGVPYVRVPTSIIGMVDAAIGAKTAVNAHGHKNRLGSYHPSATTVIDPGLLASLPGRQVSNGVAEILKMALIGNPSLFATLESYAEQLLETKFMSPVGRQVLAQAIDDMLAHLEPNLLEVSLYRLVDFGHTFSPVLELFPGGGLLHGEAVAIDMALCSVIAQERGMLSAESCDRILRLLRRFRLPENVGWASLDLLMSGLDDAIRHRNGQQNFVVPVSLGAANFIQDVQRVEVGQAWSILRDLARSEDAGALV